MKLQQTLNSNINQNMQQHNGRAKSHKKLSFKGGEALTQAMTFLQTNQGLGASFVDAAFMCTPRTIVDFSRGPEAGMETGRREFSSNINDTLLGTYGLGAGWLLSQGFNKKYDVKAHKIPVDADMIDAVSEIRYKSGDINKIENLKSYLDELFERTKGLKPNVDNNGSQWVPLDKSSKEALVGRLSKELTAETEQTKGQLKDAKAYLKALIVSSTGSEGDICLETKTGQIDPNTNKEIIKKTVSSVDDFINDIYKVSKMFMSKEVTDIFGSEKLADSAVIKTAIENNKFLKEFKHLKIGTAGLGIAACSLIGASVQPLNVYLTKKKTGKSGFVGGGEEDKSTGFKLIKLGVAGVAAAAMLRTIGKFGDIPKAIQFKGIWPTIPQFKLVYAITIISRLLSARNDNELRESTIKDSLSFANWLIVGGFVSKLAAMGCEKAVKFKEGSKVDNVFVKYNTQENLIKKGIFKGKHSPKWLTGTVVSREEVLHQALDKAGVIIGDKALGFKDMLKKAFKESPEAKTKIRCLAMIQTVGYLWSALALGFAIPKLNIAITKAVEKSKNSKEQSEQKAAV